jgi:hypothetical protein
MLLDDGQKHKLLLTGHRIAWFAPNRPVEGGTVFVRPTASDENVDSASAHVDESVVDAAD